MLFQFDYQFLFSKQFSKPKTSPVTKKPLEAPKSEGPVDHVAFVIHGIGQQTEQFGFFQNHLNSLYDTTVDVIAKNSYKPVNIQYIPIEWHKHIHEETDQSMKDITPTSIPMIRMINNDYLSDAFFYLSKERGQSIINHVTSSFNQAYAAFIKENPNFNGKIAILAYSLGGIIAWDILTNQKKMPHSTLDLHFPALQFKPDFLFTLGSPLSAFLTVRNQDPTFYRPDPSIVFENIFHPFDPLGYRFEPMLNAKYKQVPAVLIEQGDHHRNSFVDMVKDYFTPSKEVLPVTSTKRRSIELESPSKRLRKSQDTVNSTLTDNTKEPVFSNLSNRTDFVLLPQSFIHPYLSSLTAHFSYWNNKDLLWHIVRRLEKKT